MKKILIIGAGRSASSLIKYLIDKSEVENLHITIGDLSEDLAKKKTNNHKNARAIAFDIFNEAQRKEEIQQADIVVSMLPAHLHIDQSTAHTAKYLMVVQHNCWHLELLMELKRSQLWFENKK